METTLSFSQRDLLRGREARIGGPVLVQAGLGEVVEDPLVALVERQALAGERIGVRGILRQGQQDERKERGCSETEDRGHGECGAFPL